MMWIESAMRYFPTAIILLALGCTVDNQSPSNRDGDQDFFVTQVAPILREKCSFLGCHGREGMPLTFYTVDYLRLRDPDGLIDVSRPPLDERNLTEVEVAHNRRAMSARVGPDDPAGDRERFLRRLISEDMGGMPHADTVVFEQPADPQLEILHEFLESVRAR